MSDCKWLASPQRKDDYGDLQLAMFLEAYFNHSWEELSHYERPTRCRRFARKAIQRRPRYISAGGYLTENLTFVLSPYRLGGLL